MARCYRGPESRRLVNTEGARDLAIIAVIAVAPLAIVLIVALLKSYTITLHMTRRSKRERDEN